MNLTAPRTDTPEAAERPRQRMSDLADGRLEADDLAGACREWAADAEARRAWHAYQLIGDVLRSDDLAGDASRDSAFLAAVRGRLVAEPPVFAPSPAARRRRQAWLFPMAVAAGFVAVAGVVVVLQQAAPEAAFAGPQLAGSGGGGGMLAVKDAPSSGQMLRDAQVDAYLRAHREALDGSPAALPGGGLRNVDFIITPR